jgi:thiol-disulfide isomerase/thioredoxin
MVLKFLIGICVSFFVCSCQSSTQENKIRPKPTKIYQEQGILLKSYDYKSFEPMLHHNNDTIYVINFWATWCEPCVAELPHFEAINNLYAHEKFKMILVSLDFPKMIKNRLIPFIKANNFSAEVIFLDDVDANSWVDKINPDWSGAIPATLIYKNNLRKFYEKSFTFQTLKIEIDKFAY